MKFKKEGTHEGEIYINILLKERKDTIVIHK